MSQTLNSLKSRYTRGDLDSNKYYYRIRMGAVPEYVGRFTGVYSSGSGDGRMIHVHFDDCGKHHDVSEDMWGSRSGDDLSYFIDEDAFISAGQSTGTPGIYLYHIDSDTMAYVDISKHRGARNAFEDAINSSDRCTTYTSQRRESLSDK